MTYKGIEGKLSIYFHYVSLWSLLCKCRLSYEVLDSSKIFLLELNS